MAFKDVCPLKIDHENNVWVKFLIGHNSDGNANSESISETYSKSPVPNRDSCVKLNFEDVSIYGCKPFLEDLYVVLCKKCKKYIKFQYFNFHIKDNKCNPIPPLPRPDTFNMSEEKLCFKRPREVTTFHHSSYTKKFCNPDTLTPKYDKLPESLDWMMPRPVCGNEIVLDKQCSNSPFMNNCVMDEFNGVDNSLPGLKTSNEKSFQEENQLHFTPSKKRRLSDSFPDFQHFIADTFNSTLLTKRLSNFLPLLLIQGLTKNQVSEKDEFLPSQHKDVTNILESLLIVMKASINCPSKNQTLEYCQTVLEETTARVDDSFVICYFLENLLSSDALLKHAALTLLCSYCLERQFNLPLARYLLKSIVSLYRHDNLHVLELSWQTVNAIIKNLKHADQIRIVSDVCLAVKLAVFNSREKKYLPGLCHPKGFDSIFPLYEKVMLKGIMKDKKLAAQALHQLIMFSSEDALQPSICSLASVLICIISKFKHDPYIRTKIVLVDTLTALLAKVGVRLKLYFPQIQSTYLTALRSDSRALQLRCIRGLCCLVRFNAQLEPLYNFFSNNIKRENYAVKKIMLFAMRCVVKCACVPLQGNLCHGILVLLLTILDNQVSACRIAAAGCIGTIIGCLPSHECQKVVKLYFLENEASLACALKHSRCTTIMVILKEHPEKLLLQEKMSQKLCDIILSYMESEKVDIVVSAIKACGFFILFKLSLNEKEINPSLLEKFCKTMNHNSEEIKNTFVLVINFLANKMVLPLYILQQVVPFLLSGIKDRHDKMKSSCEFALTAVLNLYTQNEIAQIYMNTLETDAQEIFQNVITNLKVLARQPKPKEEELDFTLM